MAKPTRIAISTHTSVPPDKDSLARGKNFWERECSTCHNSDGKGAGPGSKELNLEVVNLIVHNTWDQPDGALYYKISIGRRPMPGFKKLLKEKERWDVINYMRSLFSATFKAKRKIKQRSDSQIF